MNEQIRKILVREEKKLAFLRGFIVGISLATFIVTIAIFAI